MAAIADGGVPAVAVDRLKDAVGATRGSFYWHFKDRGELVEAALALWEREYTTELIPLAEAVPDPRARLRALFERVYEPRADPIEVALAKAADDPLVAPVWARVSEARMGLIHAIFLELGLSEAEADSRTWLAWAFYVGHHLLDDAPARPERLGRIVDLLGS
ncbi:TetR/AcrR family transcriptional regulator [Solirubrobacter phytolaccae]|uniref:TetR/AcrR family transcriptional regulator n=1 Tax=Solirubrobacter phytolaccae TaxID=1404360 RepID=A0A9X3SAL9_9ACTN|nr:TetR/AcrR family transcriptional regulator [Solirubrobacter phytolaccae]MDA0184609.1 TetR/AcrR family transcriptional regulator [Solirubrobacter phytolaccae]